MSPLRPRITLLPVAFTSYIDKVYPFCNILFQMLAGIPLSIHCMLRRYTPPPLASKPIFCIKSYRCSLPSLFIDTRGCPFSCAVPFFLGCAWA